MKTPETILKITRRFRMTPKGLLTNAYHKQIERSKHRGFQRPSYSLAQLHKRFLSDRKFIRLFREWVKGGFKFYDRPSIDRVDCLKPYTLENIQIMTWKQNRRKGDWEQSKFYKSTEVWMCDMDGKKIKKFESIKSAVLETGCNQGLISAVCQGKRNQTGGFKWKYGKLGVKSKKFEVLGNIYKHHHLLEVK